MPTTYIRVPGPIRRRCQRANGILLGLGILISAMPASAQIGSCDSPDLEPAIFSASVPADGTAPLVLHFDDTNPASEVTGYNVYGSLDPSLPQSDWELLAHDSGDQDPAVPGIQWSEPFTEPPFELPVGSVRFYLVSAYHGPCALEGPWKALRVSSVEDSVDLVPGDGACQAATGGCTLRAAVQEANALGGKETIVVGAEAYALHLAGAGEDAGSAGDLDLTADVVVRGVAASQTLIDAQGIDRVFHLLPGVEATIADLTLQGGDAGGGGGLLVDSLAVGKLVAVAVNGNHSGADGGGVAVNPTGTLKAERSTLSRNVAEGNGGGLAADGAVTMENSTVGWNAAGGMEPAGASGAEDALGGGIFVGPNGTASLLHVTLSDNRAGVGGALANLGSLDLRNSIVANSHGGGNCDGNVTSLGYNLSSDLSCDLAGTGDQLDLDPLLGPLQTYGGGGVGTQPPKEGSPVIDAAQACSPGDQTLEPRSTLCSIGASEYKPFDVWMGTGLLYVGDHPWNGLTAGGGVQILNLGSNQVGGFLTLTDVAQMAPHPDGSRLYMLQQSPLQEWLIQYDALQNAATGVAASPTLRYVALSPSGTTAFLSDDYDNAVDVISTATNQVTATIPLTFSPGAIAVHPFGYKAYVAGGFGLTVVHVPSRTVIGSISGTGIVTDVIFHPNGTRAYVLSVLAGLVTVLDGFTDQVIDTISFPPGAHQQAGAIAIRPDGQVLYVAHTGIDVISTASHLVTDNIVFGTIRRIRFHPLGPRAYLASCSSILVDPFAVVNSSTHSIVATPSVSSSPCGMAIRP